MNTAISNMINWSLIVIILLLVSVLLIFLKGEKSLSVNTILSFKGTEEEFKKLSIFARVIKRILDILFSAAALLALLIPLIIIWIAIKLEDGGPAIWRQEYIGMKYKKYYVYKFRSMKMPRAYDSPAKEFKMEYDDRITRIGHFIRKTSLDELPMLFSVLKGDMSLVGLPNLREVFLMHDKLKTDGLKYDVYYNYEKPGLVSLGSVVLPPHERTFKNEAICSEYYLCNHSLALDIKIFFKGIVSSLYVERSDY